MPRLPRLHVPGGYCHVILRGNHREDLFSTPADRLKLNDIVATSLAKYQARLHAFCWMTNHIHTLLQIGNVPLGKVVQRIATLYSKYRHRLLNTSGHLFERRHRAWLIDTDSYMIAVLRYIHLNPVAARMLHAATDYPWSSHRAYLGTEIFPWLTVDFGLSMFGSTVDVARTSYQKLLAGELFASEEQLHQETHPDDPRVLGGDKFLVSLPPPRFKPRSRLSLEELATLVCEQMQVSVEALWSTSKARHLSKARAELARRALDGRVASLHEVGRYLGRHHSGISRLVNRQ